MNLRIFQHVEIEGPGVIADWARERGFAIATTHFHRGEPLPEPASVDFLVVMGGPMNIYQDRDHPWLRAERAWIGQHINAGRPAVGVCLGSQLIADALGSRVTQNPKIEIGWFPVQFTREARARFPFLPASHELIHWHGDTFELPESAMPLASSEACANQGFLYQDRVLGLQFHPEMTHEGLRLLVEAEAASLQPGPHVQTGEVIQAKCDTAFTSAHALLKGMLDELKY